MDPNPRVVRQVPAPLRHYGLRDTEVKDRGAASVGGQVGRTLGLRRTLSPAVRALASALGLTSRCRLEGDVGNPVFALRSPTLRPA